MIREELINTPIECGVRSLVILHAIHPRRCDLKRLVTYTQFCNNLDQINDYVKWDDVNAKYWSDPTVKDRKQAEFLVHESFPWASIIGVGAINQPVADEVNALLQNVDHKPKIVVKPGWYY